MNAQPDPIVSGSSLPPKVPLLCRNCRPDDVVTSVSAKPIAFWAYRSAAAADARTPAPHARRNSRLVVDDIFSSGKRHQAVGDRVHDELGGFVHAERVH